ncbi:MAG: hypothetical protein A7315_00765 [Candidatus Altiarchaeales archaeon WOR_SM1_79]|nr:MAG: hypothetical protein A7315_00765 [Candidatus Altiarchaeales archaeon WOR_SM1_79]
MELTAVVKKGEKQYVALCPELDVVSQGYTVEEAVENLKEACELYLEDEDAEIPEAKAVIETLEIPFKYVKTAGAVRA